MSQCEIQSNNSNFLKYLTDVKLDKKFLDCDGGIIVDHEQEVSFWILDDSNINVLELSYKKVCSLIGAFHRDKEISLRTIPNESKILF